jgi:restriction system protein
MWMVRAEGGRLVEAFRARGVVALGWTRLAPIVHDVDHRDALIDAYAAIDPARRRSSIVSGASQVWRFAREIDVGDWAVTYAPSERVYFVGAITGPAVHRPEWADAGLPLVRGVDWHAHSVPRDALSPAARNRLAPTQTLFRVAPAAARQLVALSAPWGSSSPLAR